jgi:GrpB-like predicted nucleotidyltransferase (UPF0157 family)
MNDPIVITAYDPRWPTIYEEEKTQILQAIGNKVVAIEHVGNTAVPGLGAKPIIDIMVAVRHLDDAQQCIGPLKSTGYKRGLRDPTPECRFFNKGLPEAHRHLHMAELTSDFWRRNLLFRDFLRTHPNVARQYYELKKDLAAKYGADRDGYTEAKTEFIESVVARARAEAR